MPETPPPPVPPKMAPPLPPVLHNGPAAHTILSVNDDEASRYVIARILRRSGYAVLEASTGTEALERARQDNPSLIVLDVNLPDISGIEVCRQIKTDPGTSAIPVLHLSATRVGVEDRAYGLESGADAYLTQPVEPPVLTATVKALLRLSQAEGRARRSAQAWETVFGAIGDGVCLLDAEGRVERCNDALAELVEMPRELMLGKSFSRVITDAFSELALPPEMNDGAHLVRRIVRERVATRDGRWLRLTVEPVLTGPGGSPAGTVCIVADITDSRQSALRQRAFLRDMLASVTEGRLRLCLGPDELPPRLPLVYAPFDLSHRSIRELRAGLREVASEINFPDERWQDLETAAGEAAMNAVVHAKNGVGKLCSDRKDLLQVWITDEGAGIAIDSLHRATLERGYTTAGTLGHGFWMMLKSVDRIYLLTGEDGTTVVLEQEKTAAEPSWLNMA